MQRIISFSVISPSARETAITPWEESDEIWLPPTDTLAEATGTPVIRSTFSKALEMQDTASSISTITPRRKPEESPRWRR